MNPQVLTVTLNPALDWTVIVPDFILGEVNRAKDETVRAGGKGINVAAVLADAGVPVAATGFLGKENEGPFQHLFAQRGISDRMIRVDGATRTGIKVVSESGGETTDINFPGLTPCAEEIAALERELERTPASWVVLAGSTPPGVASDIYLELSHKLKKRGCKIALDASGQALQQALDGPASALPHLVKPNLVELEEWTGAKLESLECVLEVAQHLVERGVERVAVSMGSQGSLLVSHQRAIWAIPPAIEVGSSVGAGDALVAGLVAASLQGMDEAESIQLSTAFSLSVLTRPNSYTLSEETIATWGGRVVVHPLHWNKGSPLKDLPLHDLPLASRDFVRPSFRAETKI